MNIETEKKSLYQTTPVARLCLLDSLPNLFVHNKNYVFNTYGNFGVKNKSLRHPGKNLKNRLNFAILYLVDI